MKKALLSLLLIAGWLACLADVPATATTFTYTVDYTFTTTPGQVTGSIVATCDSCILTASDVLSWSFTASDGVSSNSSGPTAGINASGTILDATPAGIFTAPNATIGGFFAFCSNIANDGADCFNTAGLNVDINFHGLGVPVSRISWEENSSAEGIFATVSGAQDGVFPSIEIASLAAPEPPVWAMMIVGFAGCGFTALRGRRHKAKLHLA
jgi:hypothetical protein